MEPPATEIDTLLATLRDGSFFERRKAADDLAHQSDSTGRVVAALMEAARMEDDPGVRRAIILALESPIHAEYMRSQPELLTALAEVEQRHAALELAASKETDNPVWTATRGFLNGVRLVIVGIFSLFTLTSNLPAELRLLVVGIVLIFTLAYVVRLFSQE